MGDTITERLQQLPAVGAILQSPELVPLVERLGHQVVVRAARKVLDAARHEIKAGGSPVVEPDAIARAAQGLAVSSLRRVVNATGVLLHTNLGRAPLADAAAKAVADVAAGYSTLELDLSTGARGSRHDHASALLAELVGAEDAIAVNNCAAAVLLMLSATCRGGEVIVSRGELVEIGGGFRVPDVMRESGATLVEVGTTNRVHLKDYATAITDKTRAILVVHRSNFALVGFTAQPTIAELAGLGRPVLVDVGSGLIASDDALGDARALVREEPRASEVLAAGAAVVAFSGDKLFGGPQAGILAGQRALLKEMRAHPLARAVRADKLSLAALEATARLYRDGRAAEIPLIASMAEPVEASAGRAEAIAAGFDDAEIRDDEAVIGGGSLPLGRLPTKVVCLGPRGEGAEALAARLRACDPPVITRIVDHRVGIDCRTVRNDEVALVRAAILIARLAASTPTAVSRRNR